MNFPKYDNNILYSIFSNINLMKSKPNLTITVIKASLLYDLD